MGICCNQQVKNNTFDNNETNFLDLFKEGELIAECADKPQEDDIKELNSPITEDEERTFNSQLPLLLSTKPLINVCIL